MYERDGQVVLAMNSEIILPENAPVRLTNARLAGEAGRDRPRDGLHRRLLKTLQRQHGKKYASVTADAGYERLGNYLFLESNGRMSFIKPANYEYQKSAKYKKQLGRMENMCLHVTVEVSILRFSA